MNRDALQQLRLDRRLIKRRGWISQAELEKAIEALPDVSDKVSPPDEEAPAEAGEGKQAPVG
jgi:hypothetical protein